MCKCGCDGNSPLTRGFGCRLTSMTGRRRKAPQPTDERYNDHAAEAVRAWVRADAWADHLKEMALTYGGHPDEKGGYWEQLHAARKDAYRLHHEMVQAQRIARAIRIFTRNAGTPAF